MLAAAAAAKNPIFTTDPLSKSENVGLQRLQSARHAAV
jgi:hypothetical protein